MHTPAKRKCNRKFICEVGSSAKRKELRKTLLMAETGVNWVQCWDSAQEHNRKLKKGLQTDLHKWLKTAADRGNVIDDIAISCSAYAAECSAAL